MSADAYKGPQWQENGFVVDVAPLESEGVLIIGLADGLLTFRLLEKPEMETALSLQAHKGGLVAMKMLPDDMGVITAGEDGYVLHISKDGKKTIVYHKEGARFEQLAIHETGLIAVSTKKTVLLLDANGKLKAQFDDHPTTVAGLCFDPKGKRLAATHYNGVSLWWVNGEAGQTPHRLNWKGSHLAAAWSSNGKYLLTSMQENALHGWRLPEFSDFQMSGYGQKPKSFAWDSSGRWLATAGSPGVVTWDCGGKGPMGKPPLVLAEQSSDITALVAPHPELPLVAAATLAGHVLLARIEDERIVWLKTNATNGLADEITALRWSASGQTLVAGSESGQLYSWAFVE